MKQEITTDSLKERIISSPFIWIGVGVFFWLSVRGFGYQFQTILKDILIICNLNYNVIYFGSNLGKLLILITLVFIVLNKFEHILNQKKRPDLFILRATIIAFVVSQVLPFFYSYFFVQYVSKDFWTNSLIYYKAISEIAFYQNLYDLAFSLLLYINVGMLLYRKRNYVVN